MSIDLWQAVAVALMAGVLGAWGTRWWYRRNAKTLAGEVAKLESEVQAGAKMLARSRKQTDELQRLVAEYRRRLNAAEVARRRESRPTTEEPPARPAVPRPEPEPDAQEGPIIGPRGWADTQPFEA